MIARCCAAVLALVAINVSADPRPAAPLLQSGGPWVVTLRWGAPSDRIDGSRLRASEIAGFRIYVGVPGDPFQRIVRAGPAARSMRVAIERDREERVFTVTALDRMGRESGFSQQVRYRLPLMARRK